MPVYEFYLPAERKELDDSGIVVTHDAGMRVRVEALSAANAYAAVLDWFTKAEDGPKDKVTGTVTWREVVGMLAIPMWCAECSQTARTGHRLDCPLQRDQGEMEAWPA